LLIYNKLNRDVEVFNRSLQNRLKCFGKVELIDMFSEREFFMKHGQHLNSRDKKNMANRIAWTIESMIERKVDPISVKWYNDVVTVRNANTKPHRKRQGLMTL